ncbi:AraC family transcriptional regulator [Echinicola sp. 20G]|uniref:helix-turn-helix domain-containing protein n=1 Tax=Echinicola sp. 20G TaxID=2781961 RepID=UPI00190FE352|nr:helix-turn-helix domain-containing protein [Echinicola sp. 20G]
MISFKDFDSFNSYIGLSEPLNPLIDVGRYGPDVLLDSEAIEIDFYRISFKTNYINSSSPEYDPENPRPITAVFFNSPGNLYEWKLEDKFEGFYIQLSKELINSHRYLFQNYLEYGEHEALHLTRQEESEILSLFELILGKYQKQQESQNVLLAYINLFLGLVESYYQRQFATEAQKYNHIISEFQQLLRDYYKGEFQGIPTVKYFADQLKLSPNYLGDIIKNFTHRSAIDTIHDHIILEAKKLLEKSNLNSSEIAFDLGFDYPNYFAKFFKKQTKQTPKEYRSSIKTKTV